MDRIPQGLFSKLYPRRSQVHYPGRPYAVSDLSGRSNILYKLREMGIEVDEKSPEVLKLLERIKELEKEGYQFEAAEASFELS